MTVRPRLFAALALCALTASVAASGRAVAASADAGAGYSPEAAPLGAPAELRIDLKGRVGGRCKLASPPTGLGKLDLNRAGQAQAMFGLDCNTPFRLHVRSDEGGFAGQAGVAGVATLKPYDVAVTLDTDAGRADLGWCPTDQLKPGAAGACAFAPGAGRGWSSGQATAIDKTGALRLRWAGPAAGAPLLGAYRDTLVIELEARS